MDTEDVDLGVEDVYVYWDFYMTMDFVLRDDVFCILDYDR